MARRASGDSSVARSGPRTYPSSGQPVKLARRPRMRRAAAPPVRRARCPPRTSPVPATRGAGDARARGPQARTRPPSDRAPRPGRRGHGRRQPVREPPVRYPEPIADLVRLVDHLPEHHFRTRAPRARRARGPRAQPGRRIHQTVRIKAAENRKRLIRESCAVARSPAVERHLRQIPIPTGLAAIFQFSRQACRSRQAPPGSGRATGGADEGVRQRTARPSAACASYGATAAPDMFSCPRIRARLQGTG